MTISATIVPISSYVTMAYEMNVKSVGMIPGRSILK